MNLFTFLIRHGRRLTWLVGLAALLSGACNAALIAVVNMVLTHPEASTRWMVWGFVALGVGKLATNFLSQVLLARFSQEAIANLRRELIQKILAVPLRHLEEIGAPRLMVALTEDVMNITQALLIIPNFAVNLAILIGGAVYLSWLSWKVSAGMCLFFVLGALGYRILIASGFKQLTSAREEENQLFTHFRALTDGIKELKLHRQRREKFFGENIRNTTESFSRHNVGAEVRFIMAQTWSQLLFFVLVGVILFLLPTWQHFSAAAMTGYIVTTLYLMGPLSGVLGVLSVFGRANVALQQVAKLNLTLAEHVAEADVSHVLSPEFERLELRQVTHSYHHEKDDSHFVLGPMNLVIRPGELVFVVGGNGSGKSTLAKMLTGLYPPEAGEVRLDGKSVNDSNRDEYRQLFSAVFADFHLFENLLGLTGPDLDARALKYLARLHLEHKVKIKDGKLSTVDLSHGQRKRLALLTAYLEDRPCYVFDEWASDQDPQFKEIFYRHLLPDLKSRGKAVVVITHDDRYFDCADRIVKLEYGQIAYDKPNPGSEFEALMDAQDAGSAAEAAFSL